MHTGYLLGLVLLSLGAFELSFLHTLEISLGFIYLTLRRGNQGLDATSHIIDCYDNPTGEMMRLKVVAI
jgi:hypothetical protein